jgi:hypothetical protein
MGRFTVIIDDELDMEFRLKAVKLRRRLNKAFEEAMKLWLEKDCGHEYNASSR